MILNKVEKRRFFGTDGIRGKAYSELNPELAYKLGIAIAYVCSSERLGKNYISNVRSFVLGGDTRISTNPLMTALASGLTLLGGKVSLVGIAPTPAISLLADHLSETSENGEVWWSIVVSASHNPPDYNGIKLITRDGIKSPEPLESEIEDYLISILRRSTDEIILRDNIIPSRGEINFLEGWEDIYIDKLRNSQLLRDLRGNTEVTLDLAFGATYKLAPKVFQSFGYQLKLLNAEPNGSRINLGCGSTNPQHLANRANDIGFAFDGDGDRVVASLKGKILDGDDIIYLIARYMLRKGLISEGSEIVVTTMTNMGIERALKRLGFLVYRVKVGDKYVQERLFNSPNAFIGGEQSGHIIIKGLTKTGDGIATALALMRVLEDVDVNEALSWLREIKRYPQELINIPLKRMGAWNEERNKPRIDSLREDLGDRGRIIVRPSGTEPVLRVMIEAETRELLDTYKDKLLKTIEV